MSIVYCISRLTALTCAPATDCDPFFLLVFSLFPFFLFALFHVFFSPFPLFSLTPFFFSPFFPFFLFFFFFFSSFFSSFVSSFFSFFLVLSFLVPLFSFFLLFFVPPFSFFLKNFHSCWCLLLRVFFFFLIDGANLDQSFRSARTCFQYLHPDAVPLHDERIIAVRGVSLHLEPSQRDVTNGTQSLHTEPLR